MLAQPRTTEEEHTEALDQLKQPKEFLSTASLFVRRGDLLFVKQASLSQRTVPDC